MNPEFIKAATTYDLRERNNTFVDLEDHEIRSGDFMIVDRMDGLD